MAPPLLSIVTPAFQHVRFLQVCVASITMQDYPHVEHLVLDGGSTDGTREYLETSPGCVSWWRSHRDTGQTYALNEGFSKASGEWIGWQNSDDFYYPGVFWRIADIAQQHPEVQIIAGDTAIVDKHGITTNLTGIAPVPAQLWFQGHWPYNQSVFIRRDLLQSVVPLDEALHLHMDIEMFAKIAMSEPHVAYINHPLGAFRKHEGIKTDSPQWHKQRQWERQALRERFRQPMWPGKGWGHQWHRMVYHANILQHWGVAAPIKRFVNRWERSQKTQVVIL